VPGKQHRLSPSPDTASYEPIQYHIYVREKVKGGLEDIARGRIVSQEEVERWMAKWIETHA
jgi:predicted transcriptional regulator